MREACHVKSRRKIAKGQAKSSSSARRSAPADCTKSNPELPPLRRLGRRLVSGKPTSAPPVAGAHPACRQAPPSPGRTPRPTPPAAATRRRTHPSRRGDPRDRRRGGPRDAAPPAQSRPARRPHRRRPAPVRHGSGGVRRHPWRRRRRARSRGCAAPKRCTTATAPPRPSITPRRRA